MADVRFYPPPRGISNLFVALPKINVNLIAWITQKLRDVACPRCLFLSMGAVKRLLRKTGGTTRRTR